TPTDFSDDELNIEAGIGFYAMLDNLSLVSLKDNNATPTQANDDKSYLGLELSGLSAALIGIEGLTISVTDATVKVNQASDTDGILATNPAKLDWVAFFANAVGLVPASVPNLAPTDDLLVAGNLLLEVGDFVQIRGGFAFTRSSDLMVTVSGAGMTTTMKSVSVVTIGMQDVNVFAGAGPYFVDSDMDGDYDDDDTPSADAVGLLLKDVTVGIALFKPTNRADTSSYYAIRAEAESIELPGLDLGGSETFSLTASGYRVEVSGGKEGASPLAKPAINFAALPGGSFLIPTGPASSLEIDYSSPLLRVAIERATLVIDEYVYVSGGFAFTKLDALPVKLSDTAQTPRTMSAYAFGAGNVDLFVGSGPYFVDSDGDGDIDEFDERDDDAIGLALENVNFGLILMRPTTPAFQSIKYLSLQATANFAGLVGLDVLKLQASGISVEYNSVSNPGNPNDTIVVDFAESFQGTGGYALDTGNGELLFGYSDKLLRATVDDALLQIDEYVFIRGSLAFEQGPVQTVQLSPTGSKMVTSLNIGAEGLNIFFGVNGPYWNDLDGDGVVDDPEELNEDAIGLAITNADLALAILRPTVMADTTRYVALKASADHVGFVGVDVFQLEASSVVVELNLATGAGTTDVSPVVDFAATYPGEYAALFDVFDTDGVGGITEAELDAALLDDDHGVTEALTTAEQLVELLDAGGAPPTGVLTVEEVLSQLDSAFHGAAVAADADGDGKIDPVGYEIATGTSTFTYLTASQRQIHASADDVLINVAEFVYLKANFAIDLGSREFVTIRTGVPASIGSLASGAVTLVNTALSDLSTQLDGLHTEIKAAVTSAINTIKTEIQNQVSSIVDDIVAQLQSTLENAIATVSGNIKAQLEAVTAGLSVDSLVDPLLASITDQVPEGPLRSMVAALVSPIKALLAGYFKDTLEEALSGAVDRIAGSVGAALQAGLQSAANEIEAKILEVLNPQIARIQLKLDELIFRIDSALTPIFARLQSITGIDLGSNFSTIEDFEVEVSAIGISDATAFIGIPPDGGFDWNQPLADQDAIGLFVENLNLALGIFQSPLSKQIPPFVAAKVNADAAGFISGGLDDVLTILAEGIEVQLNLGAPIVPGSGTLFPNATIDFVASFPAEPPAGVNPGKPAGYAVQTGTTTEPIYIDFQGELIVASVEVATIGISEFVHITGSIAFEKGRVHTVQVTGGLLTDAAEV
ncbi:MAG TPA: hypothetical protein VD788_13145, partial [Candidatus Polarisedimenticolaceae bacterium]|nr:hypothetical protein [Candidatus Polarisedimenticolaceae bacterium]